MRRTTKILILSALAALPIGAVASAHALEPIGSSPIIRRVSDGKQVKVGDVFGQLKTETNEIGQTVCVMDREGTEVSVESQGNLGEGVSLQIDENCIIRVVAVGPIEDASSSDGKLIEAKEGKP